MLEGRSMMLVSVAKIDSSQWGARTRCDPVKVQRIDIR